MTIKADDTAPFALQGGQYKSAWTGEQCATVAFELKQQDGDFGWKKESKVPRFNAIILEVPAGTYSVTETDPSCATWTVILERIGG